MAYAGRYVRNTPLIGVELYMLNDRILQQVTSSILEVANPKKIIVFGSYARKEADEDSDLDLLVIEQGEVDRGKEMVKIRNAIGDVGIGVDVIVCSEAYVNEWRHVRNTLIHQALKEGKTLYEKSA
jgi:predicted nucleotidyltransferase